MATRKERKAKQIWLKQADRIRKDGGCPKHMCALSDVDSMWGGVWASCPRKGCSQRVQIRPGSAMWRAIFG